MAIVPAERPPEEEVLLDFLGDSGVALVLSLEPGPPALELEARSGEEPPPAPVTVDEGQDRHQGVDLVDVLHAQRHGEARAEQPLVLDSDGEEGVLLFTLVRASENEAQRVARVLLAVCAVHLVVGLLLGSRVILRHHRGGGEPR